MKILKIREKESVKKMSQSFAEIVGHDENLLALLSITDRRSSSVGNVNVQVADIGGVW